MPTTAIEPKPPTKNRSIRKISVPGLLALALWLAAGCRHADRGGEPAGSKAAQVKSEEGKTAGISVVHAEKRDIRMTVIQPGTIQAYEVAPIFSRIAALERPAFRR